MKAFKCKDTDERLTVLQILDKMGISIANNGKYILSRDKECFPINIYLEFYDGDICTEPKRTIEAEITTNLDEFLNQFRTKAYKCKSEEEKIRICELLRDNGVMVGGETMKGSISHPYIAYFEGDQRIGGWKALEYTGKSIEASTPAEFLKQWGIEWVDTPQTSPQVFDVASIEKRSRELITKTPRIPTKTDLKARELYKKQQFPNKPKILPTWREQ